MKSKGSTSKGSTKAHGDKKGRDAVISAAKGSGK